LFGKSAFVIANKVRSYVFACGQRRFTRLMHNGNMRISIPRTAFILALAAYLSPALAQDPPATEEADSSSQQVEESDEEFRRRMELEDARARDLGYPAPVDSPQKALGKIDKLPEKSRDNIRGQLIDVIVENGEWEPFDALREYPYVPTAEAQTDPDLLEKEQAAWDEQIEKYHEREAAVFGAGRGPVPGSPGGAGGGATEGSEPPGAEGEQGAEGAGGQSAEAGGEAGGAEGDAGGGQAGASGTYQPYEANRKPAAEEVSTAGAQQSALDFLRGQPSQTQATATQAGATQAGATQAAAQASAGESASASEPETESAAEAEPELPLDTRGLIPIEDLDKLEGTEVPAEPEDSEQR
jgi:hypothetical protein